jgi:hypothetical protein
MTATHVIKQEFHFDGRPLSPGIADITYSDSNCDIPTRYKIEGNAIDQAVDLSKITTIKHLVLILSSNDLNKLTFKVGSDVAQSLPVGEISILSQDVSTLYFSNSDDEEVYIGALPLSV